MISQNVELHNVAALDSAESGNQVFSRIPPALRAACHPACRAAALAAANVEIRACLDGEARLVLFLDGDAGDVADLYQGDFFVDRIRLAPGANELRLIPHAKTEILSRLARQQSLPFDPAVVRVCLGLDARVGLLDVTGSVSPPRPKQVPERRYLAYGSSITQGATGLHALDGYAPQTARLLGVDLLNLGFGGGAQCEPEMAAYLAGREDWDFATLELGINLIGEYDVDAFRARITHFIRTVAAAGRTRPVFCIDLWRHEADYGTHDPWKQHAFRRTVREVVEELHLPNVWHIDGSAAPALLAGLTADLVHPSSDGMAEIARDLAGKIYPLLR